jgi:hypothetical protein
MKRKTAKVMLLWRRTAKTKSRSKMLYALQGVWSWGSEGAYTFCSPGIESI